MRGQQVGRAIAEFGHGFTDTFQTSFHRVGYQIVRLKVRLAQAPRVTMNRINVAGDVAQAANGLLEDKGAILVDLPLEGRLSNRFFH